MPPTRSLRVRNPSVQAVDVASTSKPARKRSRRSTPSSSITMNAPAVETPALSFPSQVMDQLVARVAEQVTRQLSPAVPISSSAAVDSSLGGSNTVASIASSNLSELPLTSRSDPASCPAPVSTCGSSQLPGLPLVSTTDVMTTQTSTLTTPGLASAIVQESLGAAQSSLSGELQVVTPVVPTQLFVSPSLPIDARVSEKLRLKVCNNEYLILVPCYQIRCLIANIK